MRTRQALGLAGGRARHRATRSFPMADTAIHPIPKQGKFRRALATVNAWLQALDYRWPDVELVALGLAVLPCPLPLRGDAHASCTGARCFHSASIRKPGLRSGKAIAR